MSNKILQEMQDTILKEFKSRMIEYYKKYSEDEIMGFLSKDPDHIHYIEHPTEKMIALVNMTKVLDK